MDSLTAKIETALSDSSNQIEVKPRIKARPKQHREPTIAAYRHKRLNQDRMSRSDLIRYLAEELDEF